MEENKVNYLSTDPELSKKLEEANADLNQKTTKNIQFQKEFIEQVQQYFNRKKNEGKDSKQTRTKKLKAKKAARKLSNKSRKINQAKNRKNKFTR